MMIDNEFWKAAASAWSWEARPDIKVKNGSGGEISDELLKNPLDYLNEGDFVDFADIDFEASIKSMMAGGDAVLKEPAITVEEPQKPKIVLDNDLFDSYLERETLNDYIECFRMLIGCGLDGELTDKFKEIAGRLGALADADNKFKKVYEANLSIFLETYIPEALNLTVSYIEYENAGVGEEILESTKKEVMEAMETLLIGINDKVDEIYKFASIELKATAKALNATMEANGYVDSQLKIN